MRWAIFYADRTVWKDVDGSKTEAPFVGVVAVVQQIEERHIQVLHQADLYWWRGGMWWAGDIHGFVDQSARFGATWVKQGQTVRPDDYADIIGAAITLKAQWEEDKKCQA